MTKPVLYDYWRSSASYRVRIALNVKQIAYDIRSVNLLDGVQKSTKHLAVNPQGLVPAIAIDGLVLTQSLAIIEYLEDTRPQTPLLPDDPAGRARVRALAHAIAMEIHPICNLGVVAHVVELAHGNDETKLAWMQKYIRSGLDDFEKMLDHQSTGEFSHGNTPGLADCCLMPQVYNARRWKLDLSRWPRIRAIEDACREHEGIEAAHPEKVRPQMVA